jgi:hypothetical protein
MLNPQGLVSECTGENIFCVRNGRIITPPLSSGALEGITQASVNAIARDLGYEIVIGDLARSDLYVAEEIFVCGTAAEISSVNSVDDRNIPCPGPITKSIADIYTKAVRGTGRSLQGLGRTCRRVRAQQPRKIQIYDTTLRDGSQLEGISLTVEDKLRIAEQLDYLGVDFIEGGWPGANPKDEEFFRRAATELKLETSTLVAFGSTRRVKGKVDDDRHCATWSRRAPRRVHRRQGVGLPRDRGLRTISPKAWRWSRSRLPS